MSIHTYFVCVCIHILCMCMKCHGIFFLQNCFFFCWPPELLCLSSVLKGPPGVFSPPLGTVWPPVLCCAVVLSLLPFSGLASQEVRPPISSNGNTWNPLAPRTWTCTWIVWGSRYSADSGPVGLGQSPQFCISKEHLVQGPDFKQQGLGMRLYLEEFVRNVFRCLWGGHREGTESLLCLGRFHNTTERAHPHPTLCGRWGKISVKGKPHQPEYREGLCWCQSVRAKAASLQCPLKFHWMRKQARSRDPGPS